MGRCPGPLAVVRAAPALEHLGLADNWLDNTAAQEVVRAVQPSARLHSLDLSRAQGPGGCSGGRGQIVCSEKKTSSCFFTSG